MALALRVAGRALALAFTVGSALAAPPLALDFSRPGVHFDGVGSLSGGGGDSRLLVDYPKALQSDILDALFLPGAGASLQFLKFEIGGDAQSTEGTEMSHEHFRGDLNCSRGYEYWLLMEAKKRNPAIRTYGLSWGVPAWIGNGSYYAGDDNINYHLDWLACMENVHGVAIDYLGVWNERSYDADWIIRLRRALDKGGFLNTRISAADGDWSIVNDMTTNAALAAAIDVVGVHYPSQPPAAAYALNKTLWASEFWNLGQVDDYPGAGYLASDLSNQAQWGLSASISWCLIYSWYANLNYGRITGTNSGAGHSTMTAAEPWSGYYEVNAPLAVMAHWTQFAQPGWTFLSLGSGLGSLPSGGTYNTLVNTHTPSAVLEFSVVIQTMQGASSAQVVAFSIVGLSPGRTLPTALHVWLTTEASFFVQQADVPVDAAGTFSLTIPALAMVSVTTTTGQGWVRPSTPIPASQPFPFPYMEDFDAYPQQTQALYLSDMGGAWTTMPVPAELTAFKPHSGSSTDSAYLQVVPQNPGPNGWATSPNPCSVAGNPNGGVAGVAAWTDYSFSASGLIDPSANVAANGNGGSIVVTQQLACSAASASQRFSLLDGDLTSIPSRIGSGRGPSCLALLGPDPDNNGAQRLGLGPCASAPKFSLSAQRQLSSNGQCIDVWGDAKTPGQRVITWPCETPPGENEIWQVKPTGVNATVSFVATFDGQCIDLIEVLAPETVFLWIAARIKNFGWSFVPSGYVLQVFASPNATALGAWALSAQSAVLASGATSKPILVSTWYSLRLAMVGRNITATLDGSLLVSVSDTLSSFGNVAIGSGWHAAWFDDMHVHNATSS